MVFNLKKYTAMVLIYIKKNAQEWFLIKLKVTAVHAKIQALLNKPKLTYDWYYSEGTRTMDMAFFHTLFGDYMYSNRDLHINKRIYNKLFLHSKNPLVSFTLYQEPSFLSHPKNARCTGNS